MKCPVMAPGRGALSSRVRRHRNSTRVHHLRSEEQLLQGSCHCGAVLAFAFVIVFWTSRAVCAPPALDQYPPKSVAKCEQTSQRMQQCESEDGKADEAARCEPSRPLSVVLIGHWVFEQSGARFNPTSLQASFPTPRTRADKD